MHFFGKPSIQRKLTFVIVCTSTIGLSLACLGFELYERASFRGAMTSEMTVLADTLGENTAASLTFNDRNSAEEMLNALHAESHIIAGVLYNKRGEVFAEYRRKDVGADFKTPTWHDDGAQFEADSLTLYRSISLSGEKTGAIAIISDLSELRAKMRQYTEISGLVLLFSALVTGLISLWILRLITEPILQLAEISSRVSASEDYALRAIPAGDDEVGTLVHSFNHMLERIQERDVALQTAKEDLEARVRARTEELQTEVNERIRAELHLQFSLKELRDLESALDQHCIVARTDPKGMITFVNDKFCSISKFTRKELISMDHRIVNSGFHPKEFIADLWRTIMSGQVWKGEMKNRAKDGTVYWVDSTIVPFATKRRVRVSTLPLTRISPPSGALRMICAPRKRRQKKPAGPRANFSPT